MKNEIKSDIPGLIGLAVLFCILSIGAIGQATYVEPVKPTVGDRSKASRDAVYTADEYQESIDEILRKRGETK